MEKINKHLVDGFIQDFLYSRLVQLHLEMILPGASGALFGAEAVGFEVNNGNARFTFVKSVNYSSDQNAFLEGRFVCG